MIKTGITNVKNISLGATIFRKELKNISITLYDQILDEINADALAERILLVFTDERGAYKRTYAKRFEEFDIKVLNFLRKHFSVKSSLLIQDVGVSDGRTSVDFFAKISNIFPNLNFKASDYNPKVYILERGKLKVTLSHTGKVLEIVWPPFVFNTIKRDSYRHYPLNHIIRFIVEKFMVAPLLKAYRLEQIKAKELLLFAPTALNLARQDQRFQLSKHDVLLPFQDHSNVIRAMNVLNPSYFTGEEFNYVLKHIHSGLIEDGLLITGSNQEAGSLVHGGIYRKTTNRFEKLWQSGDGSSIEHQILQFTN
ncbi:MAG: hypothetical protein ABSA84_05570 [Gammaproteobacteria bacterium]